MKPNTCDERMVPDNSKRSPTDYLAGYLTQWPDWGAAFTEAPTVVKQLSGGTSNYSYLIEASGAHKPTPKKWVLRIHKQNLLFKTDREQEGAIQNIAAKINLAPAIIYQHPFGDYQICDYIDGQSATQYLPLEQQLCLQLCKQIKQIHQAPFDFSKSKTTIYLYSDHINRYWRFLLQKNSFYKRSTYLLSNTDTQRYQSMLAQCLSYEKRYGQQRVLCHHDLNSENILLTANKSRPLSIIDWEFAGAGIASMDFACMAYEFNIDINEMSAFSGIDREELNCALQIYQYTCEVYNRALAHTVNTQHESIQ